MVCPAATAQPERAMARTAGSLRFIFGRTSRKLNPGFSRRKWRCLRRNHNDMCIHSGNLIEQKRVKIRWRKHLIICVSLAPLAIPIYFVDRALLGRGGGGNWIALDFRGLIFWSYITVIAIHIPLSSIAVLLFPKSGALRIHFGSFVISLVLFVTGMTALEK